MEAAWFGAKVLAPLLPGPPPIPGLGYRQSLPSDPPSWHCPHPRGSPQRPWQEAFFPQRVPAPLPPAARSRPSILPSPSTAGDSGQGGCPGESVLEMSVLSRDTLPTHLGKLPLLAPLVKWRPRGSFLGVGCSCLSRAGAFGTPVGSPTDLCCWRTPDWKCQPKSCPLLPLPDLVGLWDGGSLARSV